MCVCVCVCECMYVGVCMYQKISKKSNNVGTFSKCQNQDEICRSETVRFSQIVSPLMQIFTNSFSAYAVQRLSDFPRLSPQMQILQSFSAYA